MKTLPIRFLLACTLVVAMAPVSLQPQIVGGTLVGTAVDPSGAVVSVAEITITNMNTQLSPGRSPLMRRATTSSPPFRPALILSRPVRLASKS